MQKQFDLQYEGPKDNSAATLRQIKGVFIADLEFPASDVQRFLETAPVVIKSAGSQEELLKDYKALMRAGARVLIIQREEEPDSCLDLEFEAVLSSRETELVPQASEEPAALELSLEPDLDSPDQILSNSEVPSEPHSDASEVSAEDSALFDLSLEILDDQPTASTENKKSDLPKNKESNFSGTELSIEPEMPAGTESLEEADSKNTDLSVSTELEIYTPEGSTLFGNENTGPVLLTPAQQSDAQSDATEPLAADIHPAAKTKSNEVPTEKTYQCSVESEDRIELTLEELQALQRPRHKSRLPKSIIVLILLAIPVLYLVNATFFSGSAARNPFDALVESIPKMPEGPSAEQIRQSLEQKSAQINLAAWFTADKVFPNRSYKVSIWVEKETLIHGSLELSTPKPAALTKEEIVNHVQPRTWLKRLEIKDLMFKKEADLWTASGPAFAYLAAGDRNFRVSGKATFNASTNSKGEIELHVLSSSNESAWETPMTEEDPQLRFETSDDPASGKDYFYFSEKINIPKP